MWKPPRWIALERGTRCSSPVVDNAWDLHRVCSTCSLHRQVAHPSPAVPGTPCKVRRAVVRRTRAMTTRGTMTTHLRLRLITVFVKVMELLLSSVQRSQIEIGLLRCRCAHADVAHGSIVFLLLLVLCLQHLLSQRQPSRRHSAELALQPLSERLATLTLSMTHNT